MADDENIFALYTGIRRPKRTEKAAVSANSRPQPATLDASPPRSVISVDDTATFDGSPSNQRSEDDDDVEALLLAPPAPERQTLAIGRVNASPFDSRTCSPPPPAAPALESLPWCKGHQGRAKTATSLGAALRTYLKCHADVFDAFRPFMTRKAETEVEGWPVSKHVKFTVQPAPVEIAAATGDMCLRDYQVAGVNFMLRNLARGMSTILADDMGLGKTAQTAAFLHQLRRQTGASGPHLIVCPVSTAAGWARELARWCPLLRIVRYHGPRRSQLQHHTSGIFIVSPSTVLNDRKFFLKRTWQTVVFDEAHALKGRTSSISELMPKIEAAFRLAITGTPVSISPAELWQLMRFLFPDFGRKLAAPDEDDDVFHLRAECAALLKVVMLRRTKDSLNLGLPSKTELPVRDVALTPLQRQMYQHFLRVKSNREKEGLASVLMNLRRVCCHPWMFRLHLNKGDDKVWEDGATGLARLREAAIPLDEATIVQASAKMLALDGILLHAHAVGSRVLVFSNFTAQLDLIEGLCSLRGFIYGRLDGESTRAERELLMSRFNSNHSRIFVLLVSTTAGGVGITLTGADTVVIYDAHFNPQMDRQAADRAHRLGQTRPVVIHRLCARDTVDERIVRRAAARAEIGDSVVDCSVAIDEAAVQRELLACLHREVAEAATDDPQAESAASVVEAISTKPPRYVDFNTAPQQVLAPDDDRPCFACGEGEGHKFACPGCNKRYHPGCAENRTTRGPLWRCARHRCHECDAGSDDAIFMCVSCPKSYCYDCLDSAYVSMDGSTDGVALPHISRSYEGMREENVTVLRNVFYIRCPQCGGVGATADVSDDDVSSSASETLSYSA